MNKDVTKLVKTIKKRGYRVEQGKGHYKVYPPAGKIVVLSSTPTDSGAIKRMKSDLKRSGLDLF